MFNFFKKKSEKELGMAKYENLLKKSFELSKVNRKESDRVYAEAQALLLSIEKKEQNN